MGVTIHYRGRLRRPEDITEITNELEDICRSAGWKHTVHHFSDPEVNGIIFQPHPKCESAYFLFLEDGTLTNIMALKFGTDEEMPWAFTKTQFAGVDTHVALCHLFHYLEKKWFDIFEVRDEAEYYETGNRREVERQMSFINKGIDALAEGLSGAHLNPGETLEDRIVKILEGLQKSMKKRE